MANGVSSNPQGPFWPLGNIANVTPGTPVNMMSLVDSGLKGDPGVTTGSTTAVPEYTVRANQIIVQGMKSNGGNGLTNNTGNIYVLQKSSSSASGGTNNRSDLGCIILTVPLGQTGVIAAAPLNLNTIDPYLLWIDADNAADGAQVTLVIQ
jgi:hypothetical protein